MWSQESRRSQLNRKRTIGRRRRQGAKRRPTRLRKMRPRRRPPPRKRPKHQRKRSPKRKRRHRLLVRTHLTQKRRKRAEARSGPPRSGETARRSPKRRWWRAPAPARLARPARPATAATVRAGVGGTRRMGTPPPQTWTTPRLSFSAISWRSREPLPRVWWWWRRSSSSGLQCPVPLKRPKMGEWLTTEARCCPGRETPWQPMCSPGSASPVVVRWA
mmetsp:Transcript_33953/g.57035  ORF Transcript_33953/g.57035 Transcript_33953/m.57035 type:complete len:217 (-) Transcript_33953:311-961(-)